MIAVKTRVARLSASLAKVKQRHVLRAVLAINAIMFCVEFSAGLLARSTALLANSVDMNCSPEAIAVAHLWFG